MPRPIPKQAHQVSVADALVFEAWPEEAQRIAFAGVMPHERVQELVKDAAAEAFDRGRDAMAEEMGGRLDRDAVRAIYEELMLFRSTVLDTRMAAHAKLGAILGRLGALLDD